MLNTKLYLLHIPSHLSIDTYSFFYPLLTSSRRDKISRLRKNQDKLLSLFAELLLYFILVKEYKLSYKEIDIAYNAYHKPYLAHQPEIHFNLSHSGEYVALAIGSSEIGVDIQLIQDVEHNITNNLCSPSEKAFFMKLNDKDFLPYFFRLWTLKESFIKTIGTGFYTDPTTFTVPLATGHNTSMNYNQQTYYFKEYELSIPYHLAVCSMKPYFVNEPELISLNELVRFVRDHIL